MNRVAWLALLALPAFAEGPSDFEGSARITPSGNDALQRFTVPFELYRDARPDMADVRVFNARGEAVPMAFAGSPETTWDPPVTVELPQFPVSSMVPATTTSASRGAEVTIRTQDGMLVSVKGGSTPAKAAADSTRTVAYVLDASQVKDPLRAMIFQWDAAPGSEVVCVSVDASDDLQSWRGAGRGSLVRLEQGGRVLEQRRIAIGPLKAKYYRVTWCGPKFALKSVQGEFEPVVKPPPRETFSVAAATQMSSIGNLPLCAKKSPVTCYIFDLGGRLPVEAVRLVLPEANSVAPVYIVLYENDLDSPPHPAGAANFFRLTRDGTEVVSPAVEIGRRSARFIGIQLDPNFPGLGSAWPSLEVQWRPAQVVFVTRGDGPFTLAWGDPDAKPGWSLVGSLMPNYKARDELKLPAAGVSEVKSEGPPHGTWPTWASRMGPRKLTLWAVLVLSVLVLGGIAWRLHRQMKEASRPPAAPPPQR